MAILYIIYFLAVNIVHRTFVSASYYPSGSIPYKLYNHTNADCSHRQLSRVPVIRDDAIKLLDLSHNKLRNLSGKAHFKRFGLLTALYLSDNQIKSFDDTTFQGLKSLLTLDLSSHEINEIRGEPFKHLSYVLTLDLSGASTCALYLSSDRFLSYIAPSVFTGLFHLEWLDLHCSQLNSLPPDIFADLQKLRYLDLSCSYLRQISSRLPASLHTLNLSSNIFLSIIEPDNFMNLTNLVELTLGDGNLLVLLPETPFQKVILQASYSGWPEQFF